jgi:hypothetical protein
VPRDVEQQLRDAGDAKDLGHREALDPFALVAHEGGLPSIPNDRTTCRKYLRLAECSKGAGAPESSTHASDLICSMK